jgi:beta-glucosidase
MTLQEKIGQMLQVERLAATPAQVGQHFIGSVLSGGGSVPSPNTKEAWAAMTNGYQTAAVGTRLGIPILYGVDAVHGHNNVYGATIFPHNVGLGATGDEALVRRIGAATAREIRATGIQWDFAPCLCAPQDIRWGRTYEGYSEDSALVARLGTAFVEGLQGLPGEAGFLKGSKAVGTVKHWLGDGNTTAGERDVIRELPGSLHPTLQRGYCRRGKHGHDFPNDLERGQNARGSVSHLHDAKAGAGL